MTTASKLKQWNMPVLKHMNNVRLKPLAGLGLALVLGGLAPINPLAAMVGGSAILLLALVQPRPIVIVYALTVLLPLTGGLERGTMIPFLRLSQALVVLGFILFPLATSSRQGKSRLTTIDLAFILYLLAGAAFPILVLYYNGGYIDLSSSGENYGASPLQVLLGPIQYYLLYRTVVATVSSERHIKTVLNLMFVASILVSVIGILQKLDVGPVKTFLATYYPVPSQGYAIPELDQRITSTLQHYSGLGAYLSFTIILALACYVTREDLKISPLLLAATTLLDSIALVLTGTLAAWIGLAVGAVIIFLLIRHLPKMVVFILIGIILASLTFYPFLADRLDQQLGAGAAQGLLPQSLAYRVRIWIEQSLPTISKNPLFGSGPTPITNASGSIEESQYFHLLIEGGLFYLLAYFLLIGAAIAACWRQIKNGSKGVIRPVAIATLAILVTINVMNVSGEYFTYVGGTQTLWTLLAIVVASGQLRVLEAEPATQRLFNGRWRMVGTPSHNSLSITVASALNKLVTGNYLAGEKKPIGSSNLAYNSIWPKRSRLRQHHQHFAWLTRLLDWHFVKDSALVGLGSTVARVLGLLFAILLARFLSPDDFGLFRYAATLAGVIGIVAGASPVSITRFLATHPNDPLARDRYYSNGLIGVAVLLLGSLLIAVPLLWLLHAFDVGTLIYLVGATGFYTYFAVVRGLGHAWKMSLAYVLSNVALIVVLFVVLGLFKWRTATVALVIYGLTNFIPPLLPELIRPMTLRFRPSFISKAVLLELTRFATPLVLSAGAYTIWYSTDTLLIQNFNPHASGSYGAAKTLSQAFSFVPTAITMILLPRVAAQDSNKGKRYVAGAVLVGLLVCLVGFAIVAVWGPALIILTFGHRYSDAYLPLLVLSAGTSIYSVYIILEGFAVGRGRPNLPVQALVVAMVGTGVTSFWLTPWLGAVGAGLSFTIGATLASVVITFNTWLFLRKERQSARDELVHTGQTTRTTT